MAPGKHRKHRNPHENWRPLPAPNTSNTPNTIPASVSSSSSPQKGFGPYIHPNSARSVSATSPAPSSTSAPHTASKALEQDPTKARRSSLQSPPNSPSRVHPASVRSLGRTGSRVPFGDGERRRGSFHRRCTPPPPALPPSPTGSNNTVTSQRSPERVNNFIFPAEMTKHRPAEEINGSIEGFKLAIKRSCSSDSNGSQITAASTSSSSGSASPAAAVRVPATPAVATPSARFPSAAAVNAPAVPIAATAAASRPASSAYPIAQPAIPKPATTTPTVSIPSNLSAKPAVAAVPIPATSAVAAPKAGYFYFDGMVRTPYDLFPENAPRLTAASSNLTSLAKIRSQKEGIFFGANPEWWVDQLVLGSREFAKKVRKENEKKELHKAFMKNFMDHWCDIVAKEGSAGYPEDSKPWWATSRPSKDPPPRNMLAPRQELSRIAAVAVLQVEGLAPGLRVLPQKVRSRIWTLAFGSDGSDPHKSRKNGTMSSHSMSTRIALTHQLRSRSGNELQQDIYSPEQLIRWCEVAHPRWFSRHINLDLLNRWIVSDDQESKPTQSDLEELLGRWVRALRYLPPWIMSIFVDISSPEWVDDRELDALVARMWTVAKFRTRRNVMWYQHALVDFDPPQQRQDATTEPWSHEIWGCL